MTRIAADRMIDELDGLRALARSLAGDAADDLLQDTAIAAIEHPRADDRPLRPWLFTVLRNRWRMDRRGDRRRGARELAVGEAGAADARDRGGADAMLDRARMLERLAAALVALDEPFREAVILRYLDGRSAADIARALAVPDGTVRWRIKTGLERLRAALDREAPRRVWQRALVGAPLGVGKIFLGAGGVMKSKAFVVVAVLVLLVIGGGLALRGRGGHRAATPAAPGGSAAAHGPGRPGPMAPPGRGGSDGDGAPAAVDAPEPLPGQGRATVERIADLRAGGFRGRVINWSTGDGVEAAELTFAGAGGDALTVRSGPGGGFELVPPQPGGYTLAAVEAVGFLPYAPEWQHSTVRLTARGGERVRGLTVFLFPAVDYGGVVVDRERKPIAGAQVRLLGTPAGEQALAGPPTTWVTDRDGRFEFHAPDDAVLEAEAAGQRGRARLDGAAQITHQLTIVLDGAAGPSLTIAGRVIGADRAGVAGALVRAAPVITAADRAVRKPDTRPVAFATTDPDGGFTLRDVDDGRYQVVASADGAAPAQAEVVGGARDVELALAAGQTLSGTVVGGDGAPIPAFTLLVFARRGLVREVVESRVVVDGSGAFAVAVRPGDYELMASAAGWAPSPYTPARPGQPVTLTLPGGASLRGVVVTAGTNAPIAWARVAPETARGGASAAPANPGTVTRADGTFELTGIPPGPLSLTVAAGGHNPRIEAGLTATDGGALGPITIALTPLAEGAQPETELIGIGVQLAGDGDALRVERVIAGGGAEAAGVIAGDLITAVDGAAVTTIGMDGAIARIRGVAGTRVHLAIDRKGNRVELDVERRPIRA